MSADDGWVPQTRLGQQVADGEIDSMAEALNSGLPLKEPELVDQLVADLEDEVLDINMVQRMTDSGRRVKKLNLIQVPLGSGSWEDRPGGTNSLIRKATGKAGSVEVEIKPAPKGLGLAAAETPRKVLELAGVEDAWTKSHGNTRTTVNLAKATYNALENATEARVPQRVRDRQREEVSE
ncbi:30S ribosomal protein S5 [Halobacteriales archaeon SW_7_65_23]|nr:MAG: 30S ribosomal protein S5 [Halobacteriales archaeon SW_7_65_23]